MKASGIDALAHAKRLSVEIVEGYSVQAELSDDGGLGMLKLKFANGEILELSKGELAGLNAVNLQSMRVRVDSSTNLTAAMRIVEVILEYGRDYQWSGGLEDADKIIVRPCARFVFAGKKYVARYRAVPGNRKAEWAMFVKLAGQDDASEGITKSVGNPYSGCGLVQFLPESLRDD